MIADRLADDLARSPAIWALACGQTLGYACLYYVFAALVLDWTASLGWEKPVLAAGPTLAILIAAALAPAMGKVVDRGRGPEVLAGGAALGALALVWLSRVETPAGWLAGWAAIGVAQAACLYEVCFAFLIRRLGAAARAAIVRVTLVAGFASTLAFPGFAALAEAFGGRGAVLAGAAAMLLGAVPLNIWGARVIRRAAPPPAGPAARGAGLRGAFRVGRFWGLAAVFGLISLNHWMIMAFLVPLLVAQGTAPPVAVLAAATVGPAQVAGRLALLAVETRIGTALAARLTLAGMVVAAAVLMAAGLAPVLVFAYTLTQGAAMGIVTILRPAMIAEVMGPEDYGTVAGAIQVPGLVAAALAPMLGALVLDGPGAGALTALSLALALAALAGAWRLAGTQAR